MNLYANLLFTGGRVYTADPAQPWAEAVAVRGSHILAVGSAAELAELRGHDTEVIELRRRLLVPGFTDSHIHLVELALRAQQVDATAADSAGAVIELVRAKAGETPAGGWIRGGGWDANRWHDHRRPHRFLLDAVAPETPVALDSKDLHSVWLNSAALHRAGITATTPDVAGGVIERDESGEPTGILRDNATKLVQKVYPQLSLTETINSVQAAIPSMWQTGIVAVHNASDTPHGLALRTFQALRQSGQLGLRVLQHIPFDNLEHALVLGLQSGLGDGWLRIGSVKFFADGALGSRTAHMLQPYLKDPDNLGVAALAPEELLEKALAASVGGFNLSIHAIGDRANRDVLNVLAEVRRREASDPSRRSCPLRHRIEHVQCLHPIDLPRLAQLDIIASVQPIHATADMVAVDEHWGPERARGAYALRSLLDSGVRLVFGSDGPIEPHAPLVGIHAAVTRRRASGFPGPNGWQSQERITVAEAVDAYTRWPAYAAGEESYRGSITPGKLADLVVLSQNIFTIDPLELLETQVEMTVLEGRIVWRKR